MKLTRQKNIKEIIETENIETQEQLTDALKNRGIDVTQATISRDIRQMMLVKVASETGGYKYACTQEKLTIEAEDRLIKLLRDTVITISVSGNIICMKVTDGSAQALGTALDDSPWQEICGVIAGYNTIFILVNEGVNPDDLISKMEKLRIHVK